MLVGHEKLTIFDQYMVIAEKQSTKYAVSLLVLSVTFNVSSTTEIFSNSDMSYIIAYIS